MNGVNLTDALMRLPAINGPGASTSLGSGLVGAPSGSSSAGAAAGSLAGGPIGAVAGAAAGSLIDNVFGIINTRSARKWEEKMYNQYNSPAALVRQYNEAGINPALMFGGSTPEMNTNTAAAPVSPLQTGTVADLLGQMMQLKVLDSEIRLKNSQSSLLETQAAGEKIYNQFKPALFDQQLRKGEVDIDQMRYGIAESLARINMLEQQSLSEQDRRYLMQAQKLLACAQASLASKQGTLVDAQAFEQEYSNRVFRETGNKPGTSVWNLLPGVAARGGESLDGFAKWLQDHLKMPDISNGPASGSVVDSKY